MNISIKTINEYIFSMVRCNNENYRLSKLSVSHSMKVYGCNHGNGIRMLTNYMNVYNHIPFN